MIRKDQAQIAKSLQRGEKERLTMEHDILSKRPRLGLLGRPNRPRKSSDFAKSDQVEYLANRLQ